MNNFNQQQLLNEFLQTPEGKQAHDVFAKAQEKWYYEKIGQPNPNAKVDQMQSEISELKQMMASLINELGGNK